MVRKRALDVRIPIEEQEKLIPQLKQKKYQVTIKLPDNRVRYMYLDNPEDAEGFARQIGARILEVRKL